MSTLLHDSVRFARDGAIAVISIAHPPANAISQAVVRGIGDGLRLAEEDGACRAAIITGEGPKFFAAGADISEFAAAGGDAIATGQHFTLLLERSRLPIVCAVNGIAFGGGCELAMACDVRIAADSARFGQPEIRLGIIPGWGGTQRLPRLIGRSAAMELLLLGDPIDANRALQLGLVSRVVEPSTLMEAARDMAQRFAAQAPLAVAATKRAVHEGMDRPIGDGLDAERREFTALFNSEDAREGVTAFLEKREPSFRGR